MLCELVYCCIDSLSSHVKDEPSNNSCVCFHNLHVRCGMLTLLSIFCLPPSTPQDLPTVLRSTFQDGNAIPRKHYRWGTHSNPFSRYNNNWTTAKPAVLATSRPEWFQTDAGRLTTRQPALPSPQSPNTYVTPRLPISAVRPTMAPSKYCTVFYLPYVVLLC